MDFFFQSVKKNKMLIQTFWDIDKKCSCLHLFLNVLEKIACLKNNVDCHGQVASNYVQLFEGIPLQTIEFEELKVKSKLMWSNLWEKYWHGWFSSFQTTFLSCSQPSGFSKKSSNSLMSCSSYVKPWLNQSSTLAKHVEQMSKLVWSPSQEQKGKSKNTPKSALEFMPTETIRSFQRNQRNLLFQSQRNPFSPSRPLRPSAKHQGQCSSALLPWPLHRTAGPTTACHSPLYLRTEVWWNMVGREVRRLDTQSEYSTNYCDVRCFWTWLGHKTKARSGWSKTDIERQGTFKVKDVKCLPLFDSCIDIHSPPWLSKKGFF